MVSVREYCVIFREAQTKCMAAEASPSGREANNREGYLAYTQLVHKALKDKSFCLTTETLQPFLPQFTFASFFANNLHAIVSCISHELLTGRDLKPLIVALQDTFDVCTAADHYEGVILAAFGLGRHHWNIGDRVAAAENYANGVTAGRKAAALGVALSESTKDKLEGCADNLRMMGGESSPRKAYETREQEMHLRSIGGSSYTATKAFIKPAKPQLSCSYPECTEELATMFCSGCKGKNQRYCCSDCQRLDWRRHKPECKEWQAQHSAGGGEGEGKDGKEALPSPEALAGFSAKALKAFLDAHLIDHTACVEKSELLTLALLFIASRG